MAAKAAMVKTNSQTDARLQLAATEKVHINGKNEQKGKKGIYKKDRETSKGASLPLYKTPSREAAKARCANMITWRQQVL
mgnify:CR=1 FL=1